MEDIVEVIRDAINARGMTITAVAERCGMPAQRLSASLTMRRRLLADEFIGLCRVLNITPDDVMAHREHKAE